MKTESFIGALVETGKAAFFPHLGPRLIIKWIQTGMRQVYPESFLNVADNKKNILQSYR